MPTDPHEVLVIDSLSEILKAAIARTDSGGEYRAEIQRFYSTVIVPLMQIQARFHLPIFCTHHISYNKPTDSNLPYEHEIMEQLPGLWINLSRTLDASEPFQLQVVYWKYTPSDDGQIIKVAGFQKKFVYQIKQNHIQIIGVKD